ncbi:hypothetical protein FRAHR75_700020 [Frankia sp. Hr75.2]|uniref:hypothetical protein n=1 Tax=Parafrankia soli TaxID=2599596 RepID=UPI0028A5776D|nr:hypothetical protein FRAHR75_700020 [Frankia sp. Hr75.2]
MDVTTGQWVPLPGPAVPRSTLCPTSVVALREPAAAVAVALPSCAGVPTQVLDETAGTWTPLPSWGTGLAGVAGTGEDLLVLWNPAGRSTPGATASLRVLSPS